MNELFPIAAGVVIGALVHLVPSIRLRVVAIVVLSVLFGFAASYVSGELAEGWEFLLFDIPQVFVAAAVTTLALTWWQRRNLTRI